MSEEELVRDLVEILRAVFSDPSEHIVSFTSDFVFELLDTSGMTEDELDDLVEDLILSKHLFHYRSTLGLSGEGEILGALEDAVYPPTPAAVFQWVKGVRDFMHNGLEPLLGESMLEQGDYIVLFDLEAQPSKTADGTGRVPTWAVVTADGKVKYNIWLMNFASTELFDYWEALLAASR